jgi:ABC-type lipoprotein release transport system permease subunit
VAGHGLRLVLIGLGIGLTLSALSARAVSSLLFGIGSTDGASLLAVAALPLTALLVSLHPAWRATRIDAAEVLRRG